MYFIGFMYQVVEMLAGHLSLEGLMWLDLKGSIKQLLFGYMVLAITARAGPNYWKLFLFQILNGFVQLLLRGL